MQVIAPTMIAADAAILPPAASGPKAATKMKKKMPLGR